MLGIIGAMRQEVTAIEGALIDETVQKHLGCELHFGKLSDVNVVVVQSGIGKVNAALATAALASAGVDQIIFVGVAGGLGDEVRIGDLVIAEDLVQHDIDCTAAGYPVGTGIGEPLAWATDISLSTQIVESAQHLGVKVHHGRIASGDIFVGSEEKSDWIHQTFGAIATEMEGAAVAQVATKLGIPFAIVRWISDSANSEAHLDFPTFVNQAAELDLAVIQGLLAQS